jgi:hypothetical protein
VAVHVPAGMSISIPRPCPSDWTTRHTVPGTIFLQSVHDVIRRL